MPIDSQGWTMSADTAAQTAEFEDAKRGEFLETADLSPLDSDRNSPETEKRAPGRRRAVLWVVIAAALLSIAGLMALLCEKPLYRTTRSMAASYAAAPKTPPLARISR